LSEVIYRDELARLAGTAEVRIEITLTREWPDDWPGRRGRIDRELLTALAGSPADRPLAYVCGPTAFVESVAETLVADGHDPRRIRTERFGASGT
jgi:ferredoxin-NADP reductase